MVTRKKEVNQIEKETSLVNKVKRYYVEAYKKEFKGYKILQDEYIMEKVFNESDFMVGYKDGSLDIEKCSAYMWGQKIVLDVTDKLSKEYMIGYRM